MRSKKVNRYYCDFCKKSGCAAGHMRRHEERCTMNPNRVCGVCKMLDGEQKQMDYLLSLLPTKDDFPLADKDGVDGVSMDFIKAVNDAMPGLRDATENCPACILAALRQSGAIVCAVDGFDFTKEMQGAWDTFNDGKRESVYYG